MTIGTPRLLDRFPATSDQFFRWRFRDRLLVELCRDYDRVVSAIESGPASATGVSRERRDLQALARKLEHEFLERLANHAAAEYKTQ